MNVGVIDRVQAFALSARPARGPDSSLGSMPVRNGLLIRLTDRDGAVGWGEIWCNFPPRGNLARLHLLQDVIAPHLVGLQVADFRQTRPFLERSLHRMVLHTGERGAFAHCFAGIDTALADLAARKGGMPLCQFLSDEMPGHVSVYASTPHVADLDLSLSEILNAGHCAVKLKIGYGQNVDLARVEQIVGYSAGSLRLMVDANQSWTLPQAKQTIAALGEFPIEFVEEPLAADAPLSNWKELSSHATMALAAGENVSSESGFHDSIHVGGLKVIQPDVAKWGGVSGAYKVASMAYEAGAVCAMHFMGTALGLAASLHVQAALKKDGWVELDANPNPLVTEIGEINLQVRDGKLAVPAGPGIGLLPDPDEFQQWVVESMDVH